MKKLITAALLAMAGITVSAHAVTVAASASDIIIGFAATGGTGVTQDLEVDLGNASNYISPVTPITVVTQFSGQDLIDIYGSNWASRTDLYFGIIGYDGGVNNTTWIGDKATTTGTPGVQSSMAYPLKSGSALGAAGSKEGPLYGGMNGPSTANSNFAANVTASNATSFKSEAGTPVPTTAFGAWTGSKFYDLANAGSQTSGFVASDLYEYDSGAAGKFLGTFTLSSAGVLTFVTIPEPSVYAAILGAATLAFVAIRRRKQQILA